MPCVEWHDGDVNQAVPGVTVHNVTRLNDEWVIGGQNREDLPCSHFASSYSFGSWPTCRLRDSSHVYWKLNFGTSDYDMQRSLAASSIKCAHHFIELSSLFDDPQCEVRSALQQAAVDDQSERFRIWAGNLGAFQRLPSEASLDYRLRYSRKIAAQIEELLTDLLNTLDHSETPLALVVRC